MSDTYNEMATSNENGVEKDPAEKIKNLERTVAAHERSLVEARGKLALARIGGLKHAQDKENMEFEQELHQTELESLRTQLQESHKARDELQNELEIAQEQIEAANKSASEARREQVAMQHQLDTHVRMQGVPAADYQVLADSYNSLLEAYNGLEASYHAQSLQKNELEEKTQNQRVEIDRLNTRLGGGYPALLNAHEQLKAQKRAVDEKKQAMDGHYRTLFDKNKEALDGLEFSWKGAQDGELTEDQERWLAEHRGWRPVNIPEFG